MNSRGPSSTILCIYEIVYDQLQLIREMDLLFFLQENSVLLDPCSTNKKMK